MSAAYQRQQVIASADTITSQNRKQERAYYFVELMQLLLAGNKERELQKAQRSVKCGAS